MECDDVKFDVIKICLKRIISNTLWTGAIDLIILLGINQKQDHVLIGQFLFPVKYIAITVLVVLLYFTISNIHKYDRILSIFKSLESPEKKEIIKSYLNLYPSIINPYAQHEQSDISNVFDNLGLGVQFLFYFVGFSISFEYLIPNNYIINILFILISLILLLFSLSLTKLEREIGTFVTLRNKKIKNLFIFIFGFIYWIIYIIVNYTK